MSELPGELLTLILRQMFATETHHEHMENIRWVAHNFRGFHDAHPDGTPFRCIKMLCRYTEWDIASRPIFIWPALICNNDETKREAWV